MNKNDYSSTGEITSGGSNYSIDRCARSNKTLGSYMVFSGSAYRYIKTLARFYIKRAFFTLA